MVGERANMITPWKWFCDLLDTSKTDGRTCTLPMGLTNEGSRPSLACKHHSGCKSNARRMSPEFTVKFKEERKKKAYCFSKLSGVKMWFYISISYYIFASCMSIYRVSLVAQMAKNLTGNAGDPGLIPGLGKSLEKEITMSVWMMHVCSVICHVQLFVTPWIVAC